ncbi:MAG: peptidase M4 family protein [Anaerolineae bacterium]|nr:peptidase M4 family protein [Anaerolineae bacterium]
MLSYTRKKNLLVFLLFILLLITANSPTYAANPPPNKWDAVRNFANDAGAEPDIDWDAATGVPTFIRGRFPEDLAVQDPSNQVDQAYTFFQRYGDLFHMETPQTELSLINTVQSNGDHLRFQQMYEGVPVWGAQLLVHSKNGQMTAVNGHYQPGIVLDPIPQRNASQAEAIARHHLGTTQAATLSTDVELVVMTYRVEPAALTWLVQLSTDSPPGRWLYFVDAHTGAIVYHFNNLPHAKNREIYDANGACSSFSLPGASVATEGTGGSLSAGSAQDAFIYTGNAYDYFMSQFGRDSYNGAGATIMTSVTFGTVGVCNNAAFNAFWNGTQMVFGAGGSGYNHFAKAEDVVIHEFTHAVTEYSAGLIYQFEQGALNESMSDIFGVFAQQRSTGNFNDWDLGEDLNTVFRNMADPTLYNQPAHMDDYNELGWVDDSGGVHINSGIPNKSAYLMVNGGTFSGVPVTGIGLAKTEQIFYRALNHYLSPLSGFNDIRISTIQSCTDLMGTFGIVNADCNQVQNAWAAVGLGSAVAGSMFSKAYLPILIQSEPYREAVYEPNDDISQAYGPLTSGTSYFAYIETDGDGDIYHFTTSGGYITISLSSLPSGTNYDLELFNSAGQLVGTSYNSGSTDETIQGITAAGKYYIYISPTATASSTEDSYRLEVTYP